MKACPVHPKRIEHLNRKDPQGGRYVLYWMQQSQRAQWNHALEYAAWRANDLGQPVVVVFGLTDAYPESNLRHKTFMLEGLADTQTALRRRGVPLVVRLGDPPKIALTLAKDASLLVTDRGYLRLQKQWRKQVAREAPCQVVQIESDLVVPVRQASDKMEFAARTLRPKIHKLLDEFLQPLHTIRLVKDGLGLELDGESLDDPDRLLAKLDVDRTVGPVSSLYRGGATQARMILSKFFDEHFQDYQANRNQPQTDSVSHMSKYLHYGQISALDIALKARERFSADDENLQSFLEELIVRRELAFNFVEFCPHYDRYDCLPDWAKQTLDEHKHDPREPCYTAAQLDACDTHDPYWNAAMKQMKYTGFMHNYMRMYWGKKILQWSESPQAAFKIALALNNRYFLDGRDPNSFTGVAWCFGLHDRPWTEREIFGKVRYMNDRGLERKCDPNAYVEKVQREIKPFLP